MSTVSEDYGIDAPGAVRNLAVIGLLLLAASTVSAIALHNHLASPSPLLLVLRKNGLITGISCVVMASWMIAAGCPWQ